MNIEIRKKSNKDFQKAFFNLMNNSIYGKRHGKCEKKKKKNQTCKKLRKEELFSIKTNYYTTKLFTENLLVIEIKKL